MRRALIRAVEKQASLTEVLDSLKSVAKAGNINDVLRVANEYDSARKELAGDVESLGERTSY